MGLVAGASLTDILNLVAEGLVLPVTTGGAVARDIIDRQRDGAFLCYLGACHYTGNDPR